MLKKMHKKYHEGELSLRDYLAAHRTALANSRTWMGNLRTSLAFFVAGVSFIRFFDNDILRIIGLIFIPIGIINVIIGFITYRKRKEMIRSIPKNNELEKHFDE